MTDTTDAVGRCHDPQGGDDDGEGDEDPRSLHRRDLGAPPGGDGSGSLPCPPAPDEQAGHVPAEGQRRHRVPGDHVRPLAIHGRGPPSGGRGPRAPTSRAM